MTSPWYAVYTRPAGEFVARDELMGCGITVFCPFERISKRERRPRTNQFIVKRRDYPLFSRYIFIRTIKEALSSVIHTRGVMGVVSADSQPLEVPERVLRPFLDRVNEEGQIVARDMTKLSSMFHAKVGDKFEFSGLSPFQGFIGTVGSLAKLDETGTVSTWVDMLGSLRQVEVYHTTVGRVICGQETSAITSH